MEALETSFIFFQAGQILKTYMWLQSATASHLAKHEQEKILR